MDLIEFLRARLDEDEAAAKRAAAIAPRWIAAGSLLLGLTEEPNVYDLDFAEATNYRYDDALTHAARHDPARVLAEVEAKRRIVERHTGDHMCPKPPQEHSWTEAGETVEGLWPCGDLLDLATVYADHPEYRPEWKP